MSFVVSAPHKIPTGTLDGDRQILWTEAFDFWNDYRDQKGCYIFSAQAGRGSLPIYVGKSGRCLSTEAFNERNRQSVNEYIRQRRGTLFVKFLTDKYRKGPPAVERTDRLDSMLISHASARNPDLINIRKRKRDIIVVQGVLNSGAGKPSAAASYAKAVLGIRKR